MSADLAFLVIRLVVGGLMIGHGAQKLFGWFGGYGFAGTAGFMGGMLRLQPAWFWTAAAGLSEFGGGVLLALGFLNPAGPLAIIAAMAMAIILLHWPNLWSTNNGYEYPLVLGVAAGVIGLAGSGAYSADAVLGIAIPTVAAFAAGLVAVLGGVVTALATRAPAAPALAVVEAEADEQPLAA